MICHIRKEEEQRQTVEGDGWSAEFWVGSAGTYQIQEGVREHKYQHVPHDHFVSTKETRTWAQ